MADHVTFNWDVTFYQTKNGFTQSELLSDYLKEQEDVLRRFAAKHKLIVVESRLKASRNPAPTTRKG